MRQIVVVRILCVALITVSSFRLAWLGDDALITLRTALNVVNGWGLGFNALESVQAYTHPLWFLLWTLVGGVTGQWAFGVLLMGIAFTGIAVGILVLQIRNVSVLIVVTALLLFSNAFMEYSTSGLENPLAYALLAVLLVLTLSPDGHVTKTSHAALLGLASAGLILTRMDLLVLISPMLLLVLWNARRELRVVALGIAAFAMPLLIWFLWTFINYNTLLPNTFAAKRNVNIPVLELAYQGFRYLWVGFENDPVSLLALLAGLSLAFAQGTRMARFWGLGVVLYLGYVLWIGGDYMGGRFLAVPVFVAVFLIPSTVQRTNVGIRLQRVLTGSSSAALAAIVLILTASVAMGQTPVALANPQSARWAWETSAGVADERGLSVERGRSLRTALIEGQDSIPEFSELDDPGATNLTLLSIHGLTRQWPTPESVEELPEGVIAICGWLPVVGIATGPQTHLIDSCGLTDRFVADIPFTPPYPLGWRSGHLIRDLPAGYEEAVRLRDPNQLEDGELAVKLRSLWNAIRN